MSVSFTIPNPMRNSRMGKIISCILILIGALLIEPNVHFAQIQSSLGQAVIDFILNSLFGLFLILIGVLHLGKNYFLSFQNFFGKKKCFVCQIETQDILVANGDKRVPYCRNHLMIEFSKLFLQFPYKLVVFHPEQDREYCQTMYPYYPISEFEVFNFSQNDRNAMEKIVERIRGACTQCKKNATVAYFRKGILKWDGGGPVMRDVHVQGDNLCTKCTLENIESDLRGNRKPFADNGLFTPYKGDGVFVNSYL